MRPDDADVDVLVDAAINGDRRAVDRLLGIVRPYVLRYSRARLGRRDTSYASADDIAQDVCLAVLTALPSYRDQGRPFLAFVYGIAAHKVIDAHRAAGRNRADPVAEFPDEVDREPGPEQHAVTSDMAATMARVMDTLPRKQQEILTLRVVVGLSAEETAEAVGSTPGAVRVAQHRALARLRTTLTADPMGLHTRAVADRIADRPVQRAPGRADGAGRGDLAGAWGAPALATVADPPHARADRGPDGDFDDDPGPDDVPTGADAATTDARGGVDPPSGPVWDAARDRDPRARD